MTRGKWSTGWWTHSEMLDCGPGPDAGSSGLRDGGRLQHQLHVVCEQMGKDHVSPHGVSQEKKLCVGGISERTPEIRLHLSRHWRPAAPH